MKKKRRFKKLILSMLMLFLFCYVGAFSLFGLSIYIENFFENVPTASDGVKTAITLPTNAVRVVKVHGGVNESGASTSCDLTFYSDNVAATEQEDILYQVNNVTTGYLIDDTPFYLISRGSTANTVYYMWHNDGTGSDFDLTIAYQYAYPTSL